MMKIDLFFNYLKLHFKMEDFCNKYNDFGFEIYSCLDRLCDDIAEAMADDEQLSDFRLLDVEDMYLHRLQNENLHIGRFIFREFKEKYENYYSVTNTPDIKRIIKRTCNKILNYNNINDITKDFIRIFKLYFTDRNKYNYRDTEIRNFINNTDPVLLNCNAVELLLLLPLIFIE